MNPMGISMDPMGLVDCFEFLGSYYLLASYLVAD